MRGAVTFRTKTTGFRFLHIGQMRGFQDFADAGNHRFITDLCRSTASQSLSMPGETTMKTLFTLTTLVAIICPFAYGAIGNDKAYQNAGDSFAPFYELGNKNPYLCVGSLKNGGSAVWIGGKWALTVAHAVNTKRGEDINNVMTITTRDETIDIPVTAAFTPDHLLEKDTGGPDIALIKLAFVPRVRNLTPATLSSKEDLIGLEAVYSGYGTLGLGSTGPDGNHFKRPHPGLRFGFQNKFENYTNNGFVVRSIFDEKGLPLEGCGSGGDSGSGAFVNLDGKWQLVAINAHSDVGPNGRFYQKAPVYGSSTGSIRVALFYPEIQKALKENDTSAFVSLTWEELQNRVKRTQQKETLRSKTSGLLPH